MRKGTNKYRHIVRSLFKEAACRDDPLSTRYTAMSSLVSIQQLRSDVQSSY